jgi:hypothetical protein
VSDLWIVVPNWGRFQHYKDRNPTWIKLYTELNSNDEWLNLTDAQRGLLAVIWVEYARSRGRLESAKIPAKARQRSRKRALEALSDAGLIELVDSKPPAFAVSLTRSREELLRSSKEGASERATKRSLERPLENNDNQPPAESSPDPELAAKLREFTTSRFAARTKR